MNTSKLHHLFSAHVLQDKPQQPWNSVVLFDESFAFRDSRERWLYTAITRTAERLVIVR